MAASKIVRLAYTQRAKDIVARMCLEEKVALMGGNLTFDDMKRDAAESHYNMRPYPAGGNEREGVPPMLFSDGPRGIVCGEGKSTCFPVAMCRGASFDEELEEEIGRAIGRELRAWGGNLFAGVCVNLPYHPGWGRSQEVYGEESFALGKMGAALVRGVQAEHVMACVKHFAFNSMEISRFKVSIDCTRRSEREVFLPHFKECVDAGAASVMSAYNLYKGTYCGHSDYLLRKVLKEEWDFDGFVMSDFVWGVRDTVEAANGGQDMEMCVTQFFGDKLVRAVHAGLVNEAHVDEAAVRIVRTILAFEDAYAKSGHAYGEEVIGCDVHRQLALRSAQEGMVLLQNRAGVLPLCGGKTQKIAVLGKLGNQGNIGDHGSSRVFPPYVKTPVEGIRELMPDADVVCCDSGNFGRAKQLAREADAVVFVVGYDHDDEGEFMAENEDDNYTGAKGGDRRNGLGLHTDELRLIQEVGPENANSVAVLIGGNTIMIGEWKDSVAAIIMAFYPGQEGGTALAQILFGEVNPSGKLPFTLPEKESDLPPIDFDTTSQYYDYYHGYARLEKNGVQPLLPYGFGLFYTSFSISDAKFSSDGQSIKASCTVQNTGSCAGTEVVQMYVGFKNSKLDRPVKLLRGFMRVHLPPGENRRVEIVCSAEKLQYYNVTKSAFELEHMEYEVYIGTSSANCDLLCGNVSL